MKTHLIIFLLTVFAVSIGFSQNKNAVISELKNDEVKIKLHRFIEFNDSDAKSGNKFLVADITLENISGKSVTMGAEYTMSITIKDANGNEYRSGLKGEGIISTYLINKAMRNRTRKHTTFVSVITFLQKQKQDHFCADFKFQKMQRLFHSV